MVTQGLIAAARQSGELRRRLVFWIVAGLLFGLLAVPWFAPLFYWRRLTMRKLLIIALVVLPFAALAAPPETVTLDVQNMTCPVCPITVRKSLEKVSGVNGVKIDFDQKTATATAEVRSR